jgi:hypothetical protein
MNSVADGTDASADPGDTAGIGWLKEIKMLRVWSGDPLGGAKHP